MMSFLRTLTSALRRTDDADGTVDRLLSRGFDSAKTADADTDNQWQRLRGRLSHQGHESAPARARFVPRFAAAMAGLALTALAVYTFSSSDQPASHTYATVRGEQRQVVLEDGSEVTLNYLSELVVPERLPDGTRQVFLTGEAFFNVARDESRFVITTTSGRVEVVGTAFNVHARPGRLEVAVISGIVDVAATRDGRDSTVRVARSQRVECPELGFPQRIDDIPSSEFPGWMHGRIFLSGTTLREACQEIENRFDVTLRTPDNDPLSQRITGILDARSAGSAVAALCELSGKKYTYDGQSYTIR